MTELEQVFQRVGDRGWLVVAGDVPSLGGDFPRLADRMLAVLDLSRPPLAVQASGITHSEVEAFLEELELLTDQVADRISLDELRRNEVGSAGLIIMAGGSVEQWADAMEALENGVFSPGWLEEGSLLLVAGGAASLVGQWRYMKEDRKLEPALGWLPNALVLQGDPDPVVREVARDLLSGEDPVYALGLPRRAVLALGPAGEVEVWGEKAPKIVLGKAWRQS